MYNELSLNKIEVLKDVLREIDELKEIKESNFRETIMRKNSETIINMTFKHVSFIEGLEDAKAIIKSIINKEEEEIRNNLNRVEDFDYTCYPLDLDDENITAITLPF